MTDRQAERLEILLRLHAVQLHDIFTCIMAMQVQISDGPPEALAGLHKTLTEALTAKQDMVLGTLDKVLASAKQEATDKKTQQDAELMKAVDAMMNDLRKKPVGFKP